MTDYTVRNTLPPWPGLIAGSLVVVGVLLWMFVAKGLLFVAGLGAFGPGILRELGWLRDHDEFQRMAARRAGYHAYLIGGLATVVVISVLEWQADNLAITTEWLRLILVISWLSWLFSALLAYWGAPKTARRVLLTFGSFWAVFAGASLIGEVDIANDPVGFLKGFLAACAVVGPFFVFAWTVRRWPRWTGGALLVAGLGLFVLLFPKGNLQGATILLTYTLLLVPLLACGIALLRNVPEV